MTTFTNLQSEGVSDFDINVGMGGVSLTKNAQGQLLVEDVFIHPQLWHFLVESKTLKIVNFRSPASSMIRLLDKAVEQRSLKVDVGEKYTIREAEAEWRSCAAGVDVL